MQGLCLACQRNGGCYLLCFEEWGEQMMGCRWGPVRGAEDSNCYLTLFAKRMVHVTNALSVSHLERTLGEAPQDGKPCDLPWGALGWGVKEGAGQSQPWRSVIRDLESKSLLFSGPRFCLLWRDWVGQDHLYQRSIKFTSIRHLHLTHLPDFDFSRF